MLISAPRCGDVSGFKGANKKQRKDEHVVQRSCSLCIFSNVENARSRATAELFARRAARNASFVGQREQHRCQILDFWQNNTSSHHHPQSQPSQPTPPFLTFIPFIPLSSLAYLDNAHDWRNQLFHHDVRRQPLISHVLGTCPT